MPFDFKNRQTTPSAGGQRPTSHTPAPRSGGFTNRPRVNPSSSYRSQPTQTSTDLPSPEPPSYSGRTPNYPRVNRRQARQQSSPRDIQIPWRIILTVLLVVGAIGGVVTLCIVYREAITNFLMQLLTWAIILLVIFLLIRFIIRRFRF